MKKLICATAMLAICSSLFASEDKLLNDLKLEADVSIVNQYIFRGVVFSNHTNYQTALRWNTGLWSGQFWATYDTSETNYLTSFESDWLEVDSEVRYQLADSNQETITAGYVYYTYNDDWYDSQEVYLEWKSKTDWNPTLRLFYDFDFNEGAYYQAAIGKSKSDREWDYSFDLTAGYYSDYGKTMLDQKIIRGKVESSSLFTLSGAADLVPSLKFTKHLNEESALSLNLAAVIIMDEETFKNAAKDELVWGLTYNLKF